MKSILVSAPLLFSLLVLGSGCVQEEVPLQEHRVSVVDVISSTSSATSEVIARKSLCYLQMRSGDHAEAEKNKLWVSSEYFNGMNHAPTIQHVCKGERELFWLEMNWADSVALHTGALIAGSSSRRMAVSSPNKDPELKLLELEPGHPDHIRISIDGKIVVFDETRNQFSN